MSSFCILSVCFAIDGYDALIDTISLDVGLGNNLIKLGTTIFLIILGAGQIIVSRITSLWHQYGVLLISALLFVLGNVLCAITYHSSLFFAARILAGLGAMGMLALPYIFVSQKNTQGSITKTLSYFHALSTLSPVLAPMLALILYNRCHNWHLFFLILSIPGIIIIYLTFTNAKHLLEAKAPLKTLTLSLYITSIKDQLFWLAISPAISGLSIFIILMTSLSNFPHAHILIFANAGIAHCVGAFVAPLWLRHFHQASLVKLGSSIVLIGSAILLMKDNTPLLTYFSISAISIGSAFLLGASTISTLFSTERFNKIAVSTFYSSILLLFSGLISTLVALIKYPNIHFFIIILLSILSYLSIYLLKKQLQYSHACLSAA